MNNRTATVILNSQMVPLGTLESVLVEKAFNITFVDATKNNISNLSPTEPDLVIVLGGPQSPYEQDKYPYLSEEINFLRNRIKHDLPTIGIALGAQLIACSQNATVIPGDQKGLPTIIGWYTLNTTNELLSVFDDENTKVLVWQNDYYEPPENSISLATASPYGCQAFQIGKNCFGLQFHAEVTQPILDTWITRLNEDLKLARINESELRSDNEQYMNTMSCKATLLWHQLLDHYILLGI